ncbi:hypothetical protein C4577_05805 [Candidatus Parcubacteria bacterium]|nr:MAG: hypothetical protein C4577_05805 [Candidatus Parcubacteria bacterium]
MPLCEMCTRSKRALLSELRPYSTPLDTESGITEVIGLAPGKNRENRRPLKHQATGRPHTTISEADRVGHVKQITEILQGEVIARSNGQLPDSGVLFEAEPLGK